MKDVYLKNPQMGDPASLDHKLAEVSQNIEKLRLEAQKFEVGKSCCREKSNRMGWEPRSEGGHRAWETTNPGPMALIRMGHFYQGFFYCFENLSVRLSL